MPPAPPSAPETVTLTPTGDKLSKHFTEKEFACKCQARAPWIEPHKQVLPPKELVDVLEDLRGWFGKPVVVHSGYRCPTYNKHVGGASRSMHMKAIAADITVVGHTPDEVSAYLLKKYAGKYGIGRYNTFTHIDVRGGPDRWDNRR